MVAIGNLFVLLGKDISRFEKLDLFHGIYEVRSYRTSNPDAAGETNLAKASLPEWVWELHEASDLPLLPAAIT